jgi:hypothetical protein
LFDTSDGVQITVWGGRKEDAVLPLARQLTLVAPDDPLLVHANNLP